MPRILFILFIFLQFTFSAFALSGKTMTDPPADKIFISLPGIATPISLIEFIKLDAKGFKKLTGKKLSFIEKHSFRINQKMFRKCIREDGTVNISKFKKISREPFRFNVGGFLLGLIFWAPGLIAALLIDYDKKPKNIFHSALMGCIISTVFILVIAYILIRSGFPY